MSEFKTHNIMKTLFLKISVGMLLLLMASCEPKPQPINYGNEACEYCRMSIVDKRYAAQLVSDKGKAYSFDAIECMLHFKKEHPEHQWHFELVSDYSDPGKLIPANESVILRSKQLPSPMGMYLTAVGSKDEAQVLQNENNGTIYEYEEVETELDNLPAL